MNNDELKESLEFEEKIASFSPESQFIARELREVKKNLFGVNKLAHSNLVRSVVNRWILILLIVLLIALGIIDPTILRAFGL